VWLSFARYVLIAVAALLGGIAINLVIRKGLGGQDFFNPSFYMLLAEYSAFHLGAWSVAMILSKILSARIRSILYLSSSIVGFLASTYLLNPMRYGGIHFFIICWGSLVLISTDFYLRANRREKN